jgi:hypothetical protein
MLQVHTLQFTLLPLREHTQPPDETFEATGGHNRTGGPASVKSRRTNLWMFGKPVLVENSFTDCPHPIHTRHATLLWTAELTDSTGTIFSSPNRRSIIAMMILLIFTLCERLRRNGRPSY